MSSATHIASICLVLGFAFVFTQSAWTDDLQEPRDGKKIKVFLLAGQSNMEGRADGTRLSPEDRQRVQKIQDRVQLAYNYEPIRGLNAVKPSEEIGEIYGVDLIFGPELFFGVAMAEAWPEESFLLIKFSAGGTSLHGAWNADWQEDKAAVMEEENEARLYGKLVAYVKEVLAGYDPTEYEIRGMFWVQGETDSGNETAAAAYGENLRKFIESLRRDMGKDELPFILFQVGKGKVVEGMKRTAGNVPNVTLVPQSPDPASDDYYSTIPNGHYDHEGLKLLGERFAEAFLHEYAGNKE